ncbi:MAG: hypothetical protein ACKVOE_03915 [Rickettsiales bacterium]
MRANVGAVVVHARDTMQQVLEKAKTKNGASAIWWISLAVGIIPVVGLGAQFFLTRHYNSVVAQNQKEAAAEHLGIGQGKAGVRKMEAAARQGDVKVSGIVNQIDRTQREENRSSTAALAGAGAITYATGAGFIPGVSAASGFLATEGLKMGGSVAGGLASSLLNKDELTVTDAYSLIEQKRNEGQPISAYDIALLRIAQNPERQQQIKKAMGHPLHKLDAEGRNRIIGQLPELFAVPKKVLDGVNSNMLPLDIVLDPNAGAESNFTNMHTSVRSRGSFTNMVDDRRVVAAQAAAQGANQGA